MYTSPAANSSESDRDQFEILIRGCLYCIRQCDQLLHQISAISYNRSREGISSSVGVHMRHILDRFQCFFAGLTVGCIDYDARKRDKSIESDLESARVAVASIAQQLQELSSAQTAAIDVAEAVHFGSDRVVLGSSVARELMSLITHTTHHLAIIRLIARDFGHTLDEDLGKASSTLAFESSQAMDRAKSMSGT